jgi:hypothetical protein
MVALKIIKGGSEGAPHQKTISKVHPFGTKTAAKLLDLPEGCVRATPGGIVDQKLARLRKREADKIRLEAGIGITPDSPLERQTVGWEVDGGRSRARLANLETYLLHRLGKIKPKH